MDQDRQAAPSEAASDAARGAKGLDPRWGEPTPTHDPWVLANFCPRPSDVFIATAPKAGTTWMQQILHQLRSGGDPGFRSIDDVVPWLELPRRGKTWEEILRRYETMPEPRLFKTHCTCPQTPGGVTTARIVLSSRDPRDCCVSFYHHVLALTDEARERLGLPEPESFDAFLEDWLSFGAWYRNVQSWWPYRDHPKVLWLRYEDMKRDLPACIERLARFLGWSVAPRQRERLLEYCSFRWMKAHADKFQRQGEGEDPLFRRGALIRKGEIGDYRTLMSPAQEKRVLDKAREMLEPEALAFLAIDR
jgi:hypothetical protein